MIATLTAFATPTAASSGFTISPAAGDATDACLAGDPYNLAALREVISRTAPPSTPVVINQHLTVEFVRAGKMSDDDEIVGLGGAEPGTRDPDEQPANEARLDSAALRIFNTRTQFEFRVKMSDTMLKDIYACHERTGLTEAGGPGDFGAIEGMFLNYLPITIRAAGGSSTASLLGAPDFQPAGWSNGVDTRVLLTPTTKWPFRTITQSSSWPNGEQSRCTMTLIGPRHLITAAHCLVDFRTSNWKQRRLTPARDGVNVAPYGFSQMTPNPPPGSEAWYIVPDPWLDPSTPDTKQNKVQWDIGLVLMLDKLGNQTGWMGYGAFTASDVKERSHYNRGYPSCKEDYPEKPANCQVARLYGDTNLCEIGDYYYQAPNGWYRAHSVSCDLSRGHSGSPIYHYRFSPTHGKDTPRVSAVVSWQNCQTCSAGDNYPNLVRRITPAVLGWISWLRETYP
ncbi:MAG: hypothetical protein RMN52_16575 [Anaerolineae bacterium]|nr:hypothetical protein [Candidatus Roseilinea sp.]MDW8451612.1 hypothetical protein [Anaerolineae bacterium]